MAQHRPVPTIRNRNEWSSRRSARPDMSTTVHIGHDRAQREYSHFRFRISRWAARPAAAAFGEKRPLLSASAARATISLVRTSRESGGDIWRGLAVVLLSAPAHLDCAAPQIHAAVGRQGPPRAK